MDSKAHDFKTLKQFEDASVSSLDEPAKYYFCAGASTSSIPRDNEDALGRYRIQPQVLRDTSDTNLRCEVLGSQLTCPIGIAPTGFHVLAHKDGEIATANASAKEGCIFILSSISSTKIEDVAKSLKNLSVSPVMWMQLYITKDRSVTTDLLKRAEACGLSAIVVTVDSPISGQWKMNLPPDFVEKTKDKYLNIPVPMHTLQDASLTFEDLKWLKNQTKLPIVVKGILNKNDAVEAARNGASAVYVSNHGGRQIHKVIPTIEVLEEVVEAVKEHGIEVYFDGGVRSGSDILIAMALGAKAVFVGRPPIWGLSLAGEEGVRSVLKILKEQFLSTMKLAGVPSVKDIHKGLVRKSI